MYIITSSCFHQTLHNDDKRWYCTQFSLSYLCHVTFFRTWKAKPIICLKQMQIRITAKIYSKQGNVLLNVVIMSSLIPWKINTKCYFDFQKSVAKCCILTRIFSVKAFNFFQENSSFAVQKSNRLFHNLCPGFSWISISIVTLGITKKEILFSFFIRIHNFSQSTHLYQSLLP